MLAQLGDIQFEGLNTPRSWSETHAAKYGEISHFGTKPSMQYTAEEPVSVDLEIRLSRDFCDPAESLDLLKKAKTSGEVLPFISGTGVLVGKFVITSLDMNVERTSAEGELRSVAVSVSLKEYVPPPGSEKEQPKGEAIRGMATKVGETPALPVLTDAKAITNDLSAAKSNVEKVKSTLADVKKSTKSLKRGIREIKQTANAAKDLYAEAKTKVAKTRKIIQRASQLPSSLDEAIAYAENLAQIDSLASIATLEIRTNELSIAADKVAKRAAPVTAFVATKESGN